jgi:hypothetical protein
MPHFFPMFRGGGLFILIMGIGVVLGSVFPGRRLLLVVLGGAVGSVAIALSANALARPLGLPTRVQYWALAVAILIEAILIRVVVARYKSAGERTFLLAVLLVVGVHFIPMAITFGPLCAALGVSAMGNAGLGLWKKRAASLNTLWSIDGGLKIGFGGLMLSIASNGGVN